MDWNEFVELLKKDDLPEVEEESETTRQALRFTETQAQSFKDLAEGFKGKLEELEELLPKARPRLKRLELRADKAHVIRIDQLEKFKKAREMQAEDDSFVRTMGRLNRER